MLSKKNINDLLLVVVIEILLVESFKGFKAVIHYSFEISSTGTRYVGVGWASASVVLWYHVSVVSPNIF